MEGGAGTARPRVCRVWEGLGKRGSSLRGWTGGAKPSPLLPQADFLLSRRIIRTYYYMKPPWRRMSDSLCKTRYDSCLLLMTVLAFGPVGAFAASRETTAKADFNRDIRPIFSEHCYTCHGPDEQKRKAGLRLDVKEEAFKELKSGNHALVPGDLAKSALVARISSTDPEEVMPPPKHKKPLKPEEVALVKQWVQEGAQWKRHWSFIPPERPELPAQATCSASA